MASITRDEVKALLRITDSASDDLIDTLIPIVEDDIKAITGQEWTDAPGVPSWKAWMKLPIARMIGYSLTPDVNGMKSESQGDYSYTKGDTTNGYPNDLIKPFDKVTVASVKYSSITSKSNDRRGYSVHQLNTMPAIDGVDGVKYED